MAENIDFQFPMKKACSQDIQVTPSSQSPSGLLCLVSSMRNSAAPETTKPVCLPG